MTEQLYETLRMDDARLMSLLQQRWKMHTLKLASVEDPATNELITKTMELINRQLDIHELRTAVHEALD